LRGEFAQILVSTVQFRRALLNSTLKLRLCFTQFVFDWARSATSRSDLAFDRRFASPRAMMKLEKTKKPTMPEISTLAVSSKEQIPNPNDA
jgi:hypothetical protein